MTSSNSPALPLDFFVSYNGRDRAWAEWIAWALEERGGFTTRVQAWDFRPGNNFVDMMQAAAVVAERTIAVLTRNYLNAVFTHPEWAAAFAADPRGLQRRLIPVLVEDIKVPGLLAQIIHIRLVGLDESDAQDALLAGVRGDRAKPTLAPPFPG